jgi:catechol 2,3-dioxygenase-like lactoylglutathione lyase family enzyme
MSCSVVGGIFEICIGVPNLAAAIRHWQAFGYRAAENAALEAERCTALYGVRAALQSVRLRHGDADSGLIRLWQWELPPGAPGPGLALAPLRANGSRWSVHRTLDVTPALAWSGNLAKEAPPVLVSGPLVHAYGQGAASINLAVFTPLFRHVVLVRHGVDVPLYGTPSRQALLGTSEACHVGLVLPHSMRAVTTFYSALGLKRASERRVPYRLDGVATRMLPLTPGETLTEIDFDDPRAGPGPAQLPGRLRVFLIEPGDADEPVAVEPGQMGYGPYTLRLRGTPADLIAIGARIEGDNANEFGERCTRFRAPDGQVWLAIWM